jgi:hypothetical protein
VARRGLRAVSGGVGRDRRHLKGEGNRGPLIRTIPPASHNPGIYSAFPEVRAASLGSLFSVATNRRSRAADINQTELAKKSAFGLCVAGSKAPLAEEICLGDNVSRLGPCSRCSSGDSTIGGGFCRAGRGGAGGGREAHTHTHTPKSQRETA